MRKGRMRQMDVISRIRKIRTKCIKNSSGNTMVSVLIGFLLLLITIAMLQQVITYTYQMLERAEDLREETDILIQEFYTGTVNEGTTDPETTDPETMAQSKKADILVNSKKNFTVRNTQDPDDGFTFSYDLNLQYTDDASLYYLGEHPLITD